MSSSHNTCSVSREKILDFLFEELSFDDTIEMDNHIRSCTTCRARLDTYTDLFTTLRAVKSEPLTAESYFQLKSRVNRFAARKKRAETAQKQSVLQVLSLVLSAAAVLLLTTLFFGTEVFPEIAAGEKALYESWHVDSSIVKPAMSVPNGYDSLVFLTSRQTGSPGKPPIPAITLKTRASTTNPDELAGHIPETGIRTAGLDFLPLFLQKRKIISYFRYRKKNRDTLLHVPNGAIGLL